MFPACSRALTLWFSAPAQLAVELGELVVVRREERAAADDVVEVLGDGPRDREAVVRARAAADLVEDDERAARRATEDVRRLLHLDHEGALAAREVVARADAREHAIDDADLRAARRHERADLREDHGERDLAHERRLAGHVRPGDDPEPRAVGGRVGRRVEHDVVRDEATRRGEPLDDRMARLLEDRARSESSTSGRT